MKIGILQCGHVPDELAQRVGTYTELYARMLEGHGFRYETYSVCDADFPDGPEAADGWLVTGSKHGAYEDHAWIPPLETLLREIVTAGRPLVGVCFGHQIIAQAMGGRVEKFSRGWSIGPKRYEFFDGPRMVHAWHQDQVVALPEGAEVIASNDFTAYAALHYPGAALSVQPHPEFDDTFIDGLIETRTRDIVPPDLVAEAQARVGQPLDRVALGAQLARFLQTGTLS